MPAGRGVLAKESSITVFVADEETEAPVEVEVYLEVDGTPRIRDLQTIFKGPLNLANSGLLVSSRPEKKYCSKRFQKAFTT